MSRTVYLVVYNSRLFPAHWSLWVPSKDDPTIGKRIHATGDARAGFEVGMERNYDIEKTGRSHQVLYLSKVDESFIDDGVCVKNGESSTDGQPIDMMEEIAMGVPPPGPSLIRSTNSV